jgi:hypothetical protein
MAVSAITPSSSSARERFQQFLCNKDAVHEIKTGIFSAVSL